MNSYSDISSFEDFRYEKERLTFRKKLAATKMSFALIYLRKSLSFSNLTASILKEIILPRKQ